MDNSASPDLDFFRVRLNELARTAFELNYDQLMQDAGRRLVVFVMEPGGPRSPGRLARPRLQPPPSRRQAGTYRRRALRPEGSAWATGRRRPRQRGRTPIRAGRGSAWPASSVQESQDGAPGPGAVVGGQPLVSLAPQMSFTCSASSHHPTRQPVGGETGGAHSPTSHRPLPVGASSRSQSV